MTTLTSGEYIAHHLHNLDFNLKTMSFNANGGFWTIHLDTMIVSWVLGLLFLGFFYLIARKCSSGVPTGLQNFVEAIIEWIDQISIDNFSKKSPLIAPLALTVFIWVFLMNFMDLVPIDLVPRIAEACGAKYFRAVPTADAYTTFALSISVFILLVFYNIRYKGFFGVIKEILLQPFGLYLLPLNVFFHAMEAFVKPFSLSLRLFGNLFAGEMIFILIAALVPWYVQWMIGVPWALLHGLIISIQAFIFMLLTVVYLNMAVVLHEE